MARRKLLVRQKGERQLGLNLFGNEDICVFDLESRSSPDGQSLSLRKQSSSSLERSHSSKLRLSFIAENGAAADDCQSVSSNCTGLPSLSSINPGSVAWDVSSRDSFHSRSQDSVGGLSKYGSVVSGASSYHGDHEDTISVASSIVADLVLRSKMRILLRQGGIQEAKDEGETLDCLAPRVTVKDEAAIRQDTELTKWGSPPTSQHSQRSEITVCRSYIEDDDDARSSPVSVRETRPSHLLASRNGDAAPSMPTSRGVNRMMSDTIPVTPKYNYSVAMMRGDRMPAVPRRRSAEDALHGHTSRYQPPPSIKAFDVFPSLPQRRGSMGRLHHEQ